MMFADGKSNNQRTDSKCGSFKDRVTLCYPGFLCLHAKNPGHEQLKKDLHRYRSTKQVLQQLYIEGQNYAASDEWLHAELFAAKPDGLRLIWEHTNMMFMSITSKDTLMGYTR